MKRRDNFDAINEMRESIGKIKKLTLEHFIMPGEDDAPYEREEPVEREGGFEERMPKESGISDIEKELIEIRKIALSVINRLADQTTSESYDTMKRIWSLVDKAIESKNNEDNNSNNQKRM